MSCDAQSYQMDKKASQSDNSRAVSSSRERCGFFILATVLGLLSEHFCWSLILNEWEDSSRGLAPFCREGRWTKGGLERWDTTPLTEARVFESSVAFLVWLRTRTDSCRDDFSCALCDSRY